MARVSGLERWQRVLARVPVEARREIQGAIDEGAERMVSLSRSLAPVDSGELRDSIVSSRDGGPAYAAFRPGRASDLGAVVTAGNTRVRYAHLIEFGTAAHVVGGKFAGARHPGTAPRPFFYPAWRALKRSVRAGINRGIKRALARAQGRPGGGGGGETL